MTTMLAPESTRRVWLPAVLVGERPELRDLPCVGSVLVAAASESA